MSPDEIRSAIERHYPQLTCERRHNPDGWSFYFGPARSGIKSNRIVRATRSGPDAVTQLKLAISSRRKSRNVEKEFSAGISELRRLVDAEIKLFLDHFAD